MKTGLALGKYSPLHKGHQWLFETALEEMDHLIVVIYQSPETTTIPLITRANWIRQLYPQIEVIEAPDGPTSTGDTPEIKHAQEQYLGHLLRGRQITAFYSSEFYGEHISEFFGCQDRRLNRRHINISGSEIRSNSYQQRHYVAPQVYQDMISNVVLLGGPGTGKTTLAQALANQFNTQWMPEYGREYWNQHQQDKRLTLEQLVELAQGHLYKEQKALLQANQYLFTDTNALTTRLFSYYYHKQCLPELEQLADKIVSRYQLWILCGDDIEFDNTWDRSGEGNRRWFQQRIRKDLERRNIAYYEVKGTLGQRTQQVQKLINQLPEKFL